MKAATIFHRNWRRLIVLFLVCCILPPPQAQAQYNDYLEPSEKYSQEELAQMVAPIALYPDALLSQVLMASTYPIELVEADRWIRRNPKLKGGVLDVALADKDWDPSVKAICHFPSILALMSARIAETTNLGNAFLAQESEVMDMVQNLRAKAYAEGNLTTTAEQKIIVEKETIIIHPTDPRTIYLPYYNPAYVYGSWRYPRHPPYYWGPQGLGIGLGISFWPGVYFSFAFGTWSLFDWHHHYIYIDVHRRPRFVRYDQWKPKPGRWRHAPKHRRGVVYSGKSTARKYGQYPQRSRVFPREIRGFPDQPVRRSAAPTRADLDRKERARIELERKAREQARSTQQERQRIERNKQERARIELERKAREQARSTQQERQRIERNKQERARIELERKAREQARSTQQERQRIERNKQERARIELERKAREQARSTQQERQRIERSKQERARIEPERKAREQARSTQQERQRIERNKQERARIEPERKAREQVLGDKPKRQQIVPDKQDRGSAERDRSRRERPDGDRQADRERQVRNRAAQEKRAPDSGVQSKPTGQKRAADRIRDNVFNQVDMGKRERQSSDRGRITRQRLEGETRGKSRSDKAGQPRSRPQKSANRRTKP